MNEAHTRSTDETVLMAYILRQRIVPTEILAAIDRLNQCKEGELQDYSEPASDD